MSEPDVLPLRVYLLTWAALMLLLAATVGISFVPMGGLNVVANLAIAVLKTLLVMAVFMHLLHARGIVRLAAAAGFFWLLLLLVLSMSDYLTRGLLDAG
ncbi:MAG TPA: cytochrome C oxidase subunit IV family protein [Pelomicrobium sp.]|nr:cytochrome C oxidase subunit IV family protein [Pelomicrobium sp.]